MSLTRLAMGAILAGALLAAVSTGVAFRAIRIQAGDGQWVDHSIEARRQIAELGWSIRTAGSGIRLYRLTHADAQLDLYHASVAAVTRQISELAEFVADSSVQQHELELLRPLVAARFARLADSVDGPEPSAASLQEGQQLLDQIREVTLRMDAEEQRLLAVRLAKAKSNQELAELVASSGLAFSLALVLAGWWLQRLEHKREILLATLVNIGSHVSNSATDFKESLQLCLEEICAATGWSAAHAHVQEGGALVSTGIWRLPPGRDFTALRQSLAATKVEPGQGLSGQVMVSRKPGWFADLGAEAPVAGLEAARNEVRAAGYQGLYAVPVLSANSVPAVLEFFFERPVAPEPPLLDALANIGAQLGRVFERETARALQAEQARQIEALSITDDLTGLLNRRGFLTLARQQIKLCSRNKERCLLFFMDLDGLKQINDTLGHAAGDDAIGLFADVLRRSLREADVVARLGGDEFVALTSAVGEEEARLIAGRIEENLRGRRILESTTYHLQVSVGTTWIEPDGQARLEELLDSADQAMYLQKKERRKLSA
jgi:diguanylate cyclase (GGDEF)-like protein